MKILVATGLYPPSIGGPATYSKLLFNELPDRGIEVVIATFDSVRKLPKIIRHIAFFVLVLWKSKGCSIIYAQDPVSVGLPSILASFIVRKKFVLKVVGDYAWEQGVQRFCVKENLDQFAESWCNYRLGLRILRKIESWVACKSDLVIVPSRYLKGVVSKWGVSADKIKIIYNSVDKVDRRDKKKLRQKYGVHGKIMVSAGRLVPWKGFSLLISIMPKMLYKIPELRLFIIGNGPQKKSFQEDISRMSLEENVNLFGPLPKEELLDYLAMADVFVLNTSYEGFSHQILEALSLGTPVITTDVGGNPEIIKDGESGILLRYNNEKDLIRAIEKVLLDESLTNSFREKGKEVSSNFSKEKMLTNLVKTLKKI